MSIAHITTALELILSPTEHMIIASNSIHKFAPLIDDELIASVIVCCPASFPVRRENLSLINDLIEVSMIYPSDKIVQVLSSPYDIYDIGDIEHNKQDRLSFL